MAAGIFIKDREMGSVMIDMKQRAAEHVKLPGTCTLAGSSKDQR